MVYVFGDFQLDPQLRQLYHAGLPVEPIEPKVFDVLLYLIEHGDHVVTKDELLRACWLEEFVSDSALLRCISEVRKHLGDHGQRQLIKTVPRKGYVFSAEVQCRDHLSSRYPMGESKVLINNPEPKELLDQLSSMLVNTRMPGFIDAPAYLRMLRREIIRLERIGGNHEIVDWLKQQIKNFCITSEIYFTHQISESTEGGYFLYACSGLLDHGPTRYLKDKGWQSLLRSMSQAQRQHEGRFLRVFFVELHPLSPTDFQSIDHVIQRHLRHGIDVALMDQSAMPPDVSVKRNMAWLNGQLVIQATDQIQWDLEIAHDQTMLSSARDKHEFFVQNALYTFSHDSHYVRDNTTPILSDLFPHHVEEKNSQ